MEDYQFLLTKWEQLLHKIEKNNGTAYPIEIGERATIQEIEEKEKELGYNLPSSYKNILQNFTKSLSFYYSFSEDTMIPSEFDEVFSGEINWDIAFLENLNLLADEIMDDEEDYGESLRGKLAFSHAGNGDIYAFDMLADGEEKPIVYWDHEEGTVTYIADSFMEYLVKMTELGCIGSEKWQFEYFLSENGLEVSNPPAIRWKQWFKSFTETSLDDVKGDMEQLISFIMYRGKLDEEILKYLHNFDEKELFNFLIMYLHQNEAFKAKKIICEIIGKGLGYFAEDWVKALWEDKQEILDPRLRSYLTSACMDQNIGLRLVFRYLEQKSNRKIVGYDALSHLGTFNSRDVITWMEDQVQFPVTEGWSELFVRSDFSWYDIKRWSQLLEKHEVTMIHALELYTEEKMSESQKPTSVLELPPREEFEDFLIKLRNKQVLRKRMNILDYVIKNIDRFY